MASRSLAVFGFGNVGRVLCEQAVAVGCAVPVIADSSAAIVKKSGLTREDLETLSAAKASGTRLADAVSSVAEATVATPTEAVNFMATLPGKPGLADVSANANAANEYLLDALKLKLPISLANKKPLSEDLASFQSLTADKSLIGYEATVGAGLPVICTLQRMIDSGDRVTHVEGQLSGTLGYILSALQAGGKFSEIVREAKAQGFTEPDPRDDLSGTDVARKALILARTMGENISMDQITVEALFPESFASLPLDEFMDRLPEMDADIEAKVQEAASKGEMLRYAAVVEPGQPINVGLVSVKPGAPLASLQGTDNLVSFESAFYNTSPTVVRGPGAGLEVTAAGVLADYLLLTR
ncbi:Homoserine dehydrogenase [Hondaea fermentalgiana]|uniref:Homoserine dehydrogenase n=1 Tax=Hondaea fermentalgiana TaxID=2315210 RepID=A0A2R5GJL7_9STRA|nr:Homoserine dehydrogenase [Hondaea fermentalgiana]|eukprot:GBG31086.1 Homoserine dehydrogenase [Hondaea fermentalgiana]